MTDPRKRAVSSIEDAQLALDRALSELDTIPSIDPTIVGFAAHALSSCVNTTTAAAELLQHSWPGIPILRWQLDRRYSPRGSHDAARDRPAAARVRAQRLSVEADVRQFARADGSGQHGTTGGPANRTRFGSSASPSVRSRWCGPTGWRWRSSPTICCRTRSKCPRPGAPSTCRS